MIASIPEPSQRTCLEFADFAEFFAVCRYLMSLSRMEPLVNLPQALVVHVRINLRGPHIDVTQHLLDTPKIRAAAEQMRGKTVTERVNCQVMGIPARAAYFLTNLQISIRLRPRPVRDNNRRSPLDGLANSGRWRLRYARTAVTAA